MKMTVAKKNQQLKLFTVIAPVLVVVFFFFLIKYLSHHIALLFTPKCPVNFMKAYRPYTTTFFIHSNMKNKKIIIIVH